MRRVFQAVYKPSKTMNPLVNDLCNTLCQLYIRKIGEIEEIKPRRIKWGKCEKS